MDTLFLVIADEAHLEVREETKSMAPFLVAFYDMHGDAAALFTRITHRGCRRDSTCCKVKIDSNTNIYIISLSTTALRTGECTLQIGKK